MKEAKAFWKTMSRKERRQVALGSLVGLAAVMWLWCVMLLLAALASTAA